MRIYNYIYTLLFKQVYLTITTQCKVPFKIEQALKKQV